jgi:hypothetical protein
MQDAAGQFIDSLYVTVIFKLNNLWDSEWCETCNCVIDGFEVPPVSKYYKNSVQTYRRKTLQKKFSLKKWPLADIRVRGLSNMKQGS